MRSERTNLNRSIELAANLTRRVTCPSLRPLRRNVGSRCRRSKSLESLLSYDEEATPPADPRFKVVEAALAAVALMAALSDSR